MKLFTNYLRAVLTVSFCLFVFVDLSAQSNKTPDPKQILQESARASLKIESIEYIEEHVHTGDTRPYLTARVQQGRADVTTMGYVPGMFIVEGITLNEQSKPEKFAFSYNGPTFRVLQDSENTIQVVKSPTPYIAGQLLSYRGIVGFSQFTEKQPWSGVLSSAQNFSYEGIRSINGTDCYILTLERVFDHPSLGKQTIKSKWFIGHEDLLPRGLEVGNNLRTIKILKINDVKPPSDYFIPIKEGYSEKLITGKEPKGKGLLSPETTAPNWTLTDFAGKAHSLKDYRGHLVIIDFWGTWCVPCMKSMPVLQDLYQKYHDKGVEVIGVSVVDKEGDPSGYMLKKGYTYQLLLNGDDVADAYKAIQLPTVYVIDGEGKIIHAEFGLREGAKGDLTSIIEKYLKK